VAADNLVCASLQKQGVLVTPVKQDGVDLKLSWDVAQTGPILEDRAIVVLPDIHLSDDRDGDIFREQDAFRHARLRLFLSALVHVRDYVLHQGRRFSTVHLGDFYDVWRAYPEYADHPTSDYRRIEDAYADVIDLLVNQLDVRVCVGNHDASLGRFPPWWARNQFGPNGRLAYAQRFAGDRVVAFHGHQVDQLERAMQGQAGDAVVKVATLAAKKLSNPLSMLLQLGIDLAQDAFADPSLLETGLLHATWPKSELLKDTGGFTCACWCDRLSMAHVQRVLEQTTFHAALRLAFVGHSHRAGISAVQLGERFVPVIDCGSWAWGRSQFAVAVEGEVSLWQLGAG
jgi:Calcineurin-like phosphoesterase